MKRKNILTIALLAIIIPLIIFVGGVIFKEKYYIWVSVSIALISCLPLFYAFEKKESNSKELTVVAVVIALSVLGRFIFAWLPAFKPITAITVIAGIWLGKESGFAVGSLSAVVSNFYFGQGPWTPFQMFAWGLIGFIAGLFSKSLEKNKISACIFAILSGIFYSLTMDIWTTLWADGYFNISRYLASVVTALPMTVSYMVSNGIFLFLLHKPLGKKLDRIKTKYGLFK